MTKLLLTTLATGVAALPRGKMLQGAAPHSVKVEAVPEVVKVAETNLNKNNDDFVHTIQETLHNVIAENELDDESGTLVKSLATAADMLARLKEEHQENPQMMLMKGVAEIVRSMSNEPGKSLDEHPRMAGLLGVFENAQADDKPRDLLMRLMESTPEEHMPNHGVIKQMLDRNPEEKMDAKEIMKYMSQMDMGGDEHTVEGGVNHADMMSEFFVGMDKAMVDEQFNPTILMKHLAETSASNIRENLPADHMAHDVLAVLDEIDEDQHPAEAVSQAFWSFLDRRPSMSTFANFLSASTGEMPEHIPSCPIAEPICTGDQTPIQQQFTFYTSNYNIAELMKELKLPMLDNMLDEYVGHHPAVFECATHRDICYQSCGSTIDLCWNAFNQCLSKRCDGDTECMTSGALGLMIMDMQPVMPIAGIDSEWSEEEVLEHRLALIHTETCSKFNQYQQNACTCRAEADSRDEFEWAIKHFFQTISKAAPKDDDLNNLLERWGGNAENRSEIMQALARTHQHEAVKPQQSELVTIWHHQGMSDSVNNAMAMVPNSFEEMVALLDSFGIDMETVMSLLNTLGIFGDGEEL